jgi:hypothetical protein
MARRCAQEFVLVDDADLLHAILWNVDARSLGVAAAVCRTWYQALDFRCLHNGPMTGLKRRYQHATHNGSLMFMFCSMRFFRWEDRFMMSSFRWSNDIPRHSDQTHALMQMLPTAAHELDGTICSALRLSAASMQFRTNCVNQLIVLLHAARLSESLDTHVRMRHFRLAVKYVDAIVNELFHATGSAFHTTLFGGNMTIDAASPFCWRTCVQGKIIAVSCLNLAIKYWSPYQPAIDDMFKLQFISTKLHMFPELVGFVLRMESEISLQIAFQRSKSDVFGCVMALHVWMLHGVDRVLLLDAPEKARAACEASLKCNYEALCATAAYLHCEVAAQVVCTQLSDAELGTALYAASVELALSLPLPHVTREMCFLTNTDVGLVRRVVEYLHVLHARSFMRDYTCDEPFPLYWNECHHGAGSADRVCNAAYEQWVGVVDKLDRSAAHAMWKHTSMSPYQPALYYPLEDAVRELARVGQRAG